MYENERCIIFDESGNLGRVGRYFVIACIDTKECKALHNIMKRKLKDAQKLFPELGAQHANAVYTYYEYGNNIYKDVIDSKVTIMEKFPWKKFGKIS